MTTLMRRRTILVMILDKKMSRIMSMLSNVHEKRREEVKAATAILMKTKLLGGITRNISARAPWQVGWTEYSANLEPEPHRHTL